ncbi:MAG: hypothetical protein ABW039_08150 [Sphingobium sp.]
MRPALCASLLAMLPVPAVAQWTDLSAPADADLRIVELSLRNRDTLVREILAWQVGDKGHLYLPFEEVMVATDFRITIDEKGADGWFLREDQRFRLDRAGNFALSAGRRFDLAPGDLAEIDGVAHVAVTALDRWFGLGLKWEADRQVVSLAPPYLLAGEENARRSGSAARSADLEDYSDLPRLASRPSWLSWPYLTANLALTAQNNGGRAFTGQGNLFAQGDLLGTTAQVALSTTIPGNVDGRITLGRYDAAGRLLGPLRATMGEIGDINLQAIPLLLRNGSGIGVQIGRAPLNTTGRFDQTDIVGGASPGWQAELYRDNQLLGFQTVGSDGRYLFAAVPLQFGSNQFSIILYGPSGERQTVNRSIAIDSAQIVPGTLTYSAAIMRQGRTLLRRSPFGIDRSDGSVQDDAVNLLANPTGLHAQIGLGYGLSRSLSVSALAARRQEDGGVRATYVGGGFAWLAGPVLASGDLLVQDGRATARRLAVLASIGGMSLSAEREEYDRDFVSDDSRLAAGVTTLSRDMMRLDGRIGTAGWSLGATRTRRSDGAADRFLNGRISFVAGPVSFSPRLSYRDIRVGVAGRQKRLDGGVSLAGSTGAWRLRAQFDYDIAPHFRVRNAGAEAGLRLNSWYLAAGADHDFQQGSTRERVSINRDWNGVRLGAEGRHDSSGKAWAGLLTLAFAIDRDPQWGGVRLGRDARSNSGTVVARMFEDRNGDGRRGQHEALVEGGEIISAPRGQVSTRNGVTVIENLPVDRPVAILPDLSNVENPYLAPSLPGRLITARAGGVVHVDIPVVETGSIELTLRDEKGGGVSGSVLSLARCGNDRAVARRARTAFDGLAAFDGVMPGCYRVSIGDRQIGAVEVSSGNLTTAILTLPSG